MLAHSKRCLCCAASDLSFTQDTEKTPYLCTTITDVKFGLGLGVVVTDLLQGYVAGRVNGKLRIQSNDKETWKFPAIKGRVRGSNLAFHFFDAPDDFSNTRLDLLFEGDRLYFHGAQGFFGAVPITLNGGQGQILRSFTLHLPTRGSFIKP